MFFLKKYLEIGENRQTWRQKIFDQFLGDDNGYMRFTNGRFMENLPTLKFEEKSDIYEKVRQLYGFGEDEGK